MDGPKSKTVVNDNLPKYIFIFFLLPGPGKEKYDLWGCSQLVILQTPYIHISTESGLTLENVCLLGLTSKLSRWTLKVQSINLSCLSFSSISGLQWSGPHPPHRRLFKLPPQGLLLYSSQALFRFLNWSAATFHSPHHRPHLQQDARRLVCITWHRPGYGSGHEWLAFSSPLSSFNCLCTIPVYFAVFLQCISCYFCSAFCGIWWCVIFCSVVQ